MKSPRQEKVQGVSWSSPDARSSENIMKFSREEIEKVWGISWSSLDKRKFKVFFK